MFEKKETSTFKYWFAHWCAYQMTALNLRAWKFKYLFHDIEKPFLKLIFKDYQKVKEWHRNHNTHHIEYPGKRKKDYEAIIIDWECSHYTKKIRSNDAAHELEKKKRLKILSKEEYYILRNIIEKFDIDTVKGRRGFID